jgi:molybdate transport system substrate-binding protein
VNKLVAVAIAVSLVACSTDRAPENKRVRVAAASDLTKAFGELAREFTAKTGIVPEITFGSSGLLAKQIEQGAPFFLFAAANKGFTDQVVKAGRCDPQTAHLYARGRIVVWTQTGKPAPATLEDLAKPEFKRIAIASPDHAPYGVAAKQALQKAGVWDRIADRIVLGENVSATLLYAKNGDADAAIVALSLAVATDGGTVLRIDPALHEPLDQQLVVCGKGTEADRARQFADFVGSKDGRELMARYGFILPEGPAQP